MKSSKTNENRLETLFDVLSALYDNKGCNYEKNTSKCKCECEERDPNSLENRMDAQEALMDLVIEDLSLLKQKLGIDIGSALYDESNFPDEDEDEDDAPYTEEYEDEYDESSKEDVWETLEDALKMIGCSRNVKTKLNNRDVDEISDFLRDKYEGKPMAILYDGKGSFFIKG